MSVIQSTQPELRYIKRENLEQEARIIGNYYRDLIRSYGVDCIYCKLDTSEFENFKKVIDQNTILKQAYGYNISPDYSLSAHTLTYMEVENDIFQLNKFGLNPNIDVNFYFESTDFACALATKLGQYKEYPIKESFIECEVPECIDDYVENDDILDENDQPIKFYLSANTFPYQLGLGYNENFYSENLSGKLFAEISGYEYDKEITLVCYPYEHVDFDINFPANTDLYKSLKYTIANDDYVETMLFLTYTVKKTKIGTEKAILNDFAFFEKSKNYSCKTALKQLCKYLAYDDKYIICKYVISRITHEISSLVQTINFLQDLLGLELMTNISDIEEIKIEITKLYKHCQTLTITKDKYKSILSGRLHGNVLFFDINSLGKYSGKIHPNVGDVVIIDFPDDKNMEKYEITECFDKQLTQDGISPLLHKYIWKCKARRYVNSHEDIIPNEGDERVEEQMNYQDKLHEEVAKKVSLYDDNEDAVYGGYELEDTSVKNYDKQDVRNVEHVKYEEIIGGQLLDIVKFECGSALKTDGYSLLFETIDNEIYVVGSVNKKLLINDAIYESKFKWLKASKNQICFINIEGTPITLAFNEDAISNITDEINLKDVHAASIEDDIINTEKCSFVKFNNCRTYMFATTEHLYAKLECEDTPKTYQLI